MTPCPYHPQCGFLHPSVTPQCRQVQAEARWVEQGQVTPHDALVAIYFCARDHWPFRRSYLLTYIRWALRDARLEWQMRRGFAVRAVRGAVVPLIQAHAPGLDILAAAEKADPNRALSSSERLTECRAIAQAGPTRRRNARGR